MSAINKLILQLDIVWTFLAIQTSSTCSQSCHVKTLMDFANKRVTEGVIWSEEGLDTQLSCVIRCMQDGQCMTTGHSPGTGQCRGYNVDFTTLDNVAAVDEPGSNMYSMCRVSVLEGRPCSASTDCVGVMSVCTSGQCLCETGYSYSRRTGSDSCEADCSQYGSTFTMYAGTAIFMLNNKTLWHLTEAGCLATCLTEQDFLCKSFEYRSSEKKCNIMSFTWLQTPIVAKIVQPYYRFYARNCKI